ncbi:hypothetical protein P5P86_10550 [Nocardioides sp. BP30]|uniref:hypothetical protein n=1 Tax=Nocardioides sp. BP30 TaxID=3036374 RepID=UPI00246901E3|nr:hypothetical protein [Nocardioides sp. BP30]WGL50408.1 hypothetical protein P5P86_10550 [Nocardioides sp. BP30]
MRTLGRGPATPVLALCSVLMGAAAPAAADPDRLGLSWDGRTWSAALTGSLFGTSPIERWVPGDSDTQHFYVRDQGGDAARLAVDYTMPPSALLSADDLTVTATVDAGAPVTLAPGTGWIALGGTSLGEGATSDVAVTAVFNPASTNASMHDSASVDFRVTLSQIAGPSAQTVGGGGSPSHGDAGTGGSGNAAKSSGPGGLLPSTGAPEIAWAVGLGLFCLGGGVGIAALSRRREEDSDAETT